VARYPRGGRATGGFVGGFGVRITDVDRGWKRIRRNVKTADDVYATVGVHEKDSYRITVDGTVSDVNNVEIAALMEYGAQVGNSYIPSRPFLRSAFDDNLSALMFEMEGLVIPMIEGSGSFRPALRKVALSLMYIIKARIAGGIYFPIAEKTIWGRLDWGNTDITPLFDTHQLYNAVKVEMHVGYRWPNISAMF